jgi:hypothetical protein
VAGNDNHFILSNSLSHTYDPPLIFWSTCHDGSVGDSEAFQQGATASKDVGSVKMDGGAVGATVVDGGGGGSREG